MATCRISFGSISSGSKQGMAHVMPSQKHAAYFQWIVSKWQWLRPSLPIMKMASNLLEMESDEIKL
jgi:hypothetical protein